MNTAQEILNVLLKMMYFQEFKSSFTDRELYMSMSINAFFEDFKVEHAIDGSDVGITIIRWDSLIHKTVACVVSENEFYFSTPQLYKTSTRRLKGIVRDQLSSDIMVNEVSVEIQKLKEIFSEYSLDAKRYFKGVGCKKVCMPMMYCHRFFLSHKIFLKISIQLRWI